MKSLTNQIKRLTVGLSLLLTLGLSLSSTPAAGAGESFFIPATNRVDMVHDAARGCLYITDRNQVLRYDLNSRTFLSPYVLGSSLLGIDLSPDGNTLAVADDAYAGGSNWVYLVDLPTGTNQQVRFPLAFNEGGTYAVAFGSDGAVIISSKFRGSGWVPLRRYDPATGQVKVVFNPTGGSMVSSSGDGQTMAVVEASISSGPLNRYSVTSQVVSGTVSTGWNTWEGAVNRDGTQFAVPTVNGTYIYSQNLQLVTKLGTYAEGPIGLAYHPQDNLLFVAWVSTSHVRMYETHTMAEVTRYDCQHNFGWTGTWAFQQGRVRTSRDGEHVFVTVANGVRWISRASGPPADLALSMQDLPSPVLAGHDLTYLVTVTNQGPNSVSDARVFDRLPAGVNFVSATPSQGTCLLSNGLVICSLGTLNAGAVASVSIVVTPPVESVLTNIAAVVSNASDPIGTNNAATTFTMAKWLNWQADFLQARTDGKQQLLWRHLTNAVPDGQISLWTLGTNADLQATESCGPFPGWTAADMLVSRQANTPHLVWTNTNGAISVWNFNSSGAFLSAQTHGPFTGWTYSTAAISPTNNEQWVLWKHTTGQVSLWRLNSNSVYQSSVTMGPFTAWSAEELAISPVDGKLRLLWKNTDTSVSLWRLSNTGGFEAANTFGPFTGWTAQTLTIGPSDNKVRILWENTSGAIAVWRLTTSDGYETSTTFGPFSGWLTLGMVMRPDNMLQLPWDRTADHAFSLWRLNDTEGFEAAPSYGPYPGWQVFGGDVDGVNKPHILWRNTDGTISLWRLSPTGTIENTTNYGPY
jgi:uncharacterized repeat protein (TIGR01451 family)